MSVSVKAERGLCAANSTRFLIIVSSLVEHEMKSNAIARDGEKEGQRETGRGEGKRGKRGKRGRKSECQWVRHYLLVESVE